MESLTKYKDQVITEPVRDNATLTESMGHAMMLDAQRGKPLDVIARRYGRTVDTTRDMIRAAIEDTLLRKDHNSLVADALFDLMELKRELIEMDRHTPLYEYMTEQVVTAHGRKRTIRKKVTNVLAKTKIKSERRQVIVATKAILSINTGEGGQPSGDEMSEAANAISLSASEVIREVFTPMMDRIETRAEQRGRAQAETSNGAIDPREPVVEAEVIKTNEEQNHE